MGATDAYGWGWEETAEAITLRTCSSFTPVPVAPDSGGSNGRSVGRESARSHGYHRTHHMIGHTSLSGIVQNSGHRFHIQSTGFQSGLNNICHFLHKSLFNSGGFNLINSRSGCRRSSLLSHTGKGTRKRKCQRTKRRLCHEPGFHKGSI